MCVYSAIIDYEKNRWRDRWPGLVPGPYETPPPSPPNPVVSPQELDQLKKELESLRKLLESAKEFDASTGQPDCELESKRQLLREMANRLGIEITFT